MYKRRDVRRRNSGAGVELPREQSRQCMPQNWKISDQDFVVRFDIIRVQFISKNTQSNLVFSVCKGGTISGGREAT
jgi:hypothetical protein